MPRQDIYRPSFPKLGIERFEVPVTEPTTLDEALAGDTDYTFQSEEQIVRYAVAQARITFRGPIEEAIQGGELEATPEGVKAFLAEHTVPEKRERKAKRKIRMARSATDKMSKAELVAAMEAAGIFDED